MKFYLLFLMFSVVLGYLWWPLLIPCYLVFLFCVMVQAHLFEQPPVEWDNHVIPTAHLRD